MPGNIVVPEDENLNSENNLVNNDQNAAKNLG